MSVGVFLFRGIPYTIRIPGGGAGVFELNIFGKQNDGINNLMCGHIYMFIVCLVRTACGN